MRQFQIGPEQVPEDLFWLYELVGIDRFLQIVDTAGGDCIYIPQRSPLERELRKNAIVREYNGSNSMQLARKYGLSDRHVRTILQEGREKRPS